ncbi:MAG TPA: hypothetical protein V6D25_14485 [Leptolyngbyaceae cyanobacterium]
MPNEPENDPFFVELCQEYTSSQIAEIEQYLTEWDKASYISVSHNVLDHAARKEIDPLKLLRKAHNFSKKGALRVPKSGYRQDGSAVYRKGNEYLIVRPDKFGTEKIVTYGINDD